MPYKRAKVKKKYVPRSGKLLDKVREVLRCRHYSLRTEESYVSWILKPGTIFPALKDGLPLQAGRLEQQESFMAAKTVKPSREWWLSRGGRPQKIFP